MLSSTLAASILLAPAFVLAQQTISPGASADRCVQPQHASMVDGTPVVLAPCTGGTEQDFFFEDSGLVRVFSNQCLTVPADAVAGNPLQIATCSDTEVAQQWTYDEAGKTLQNKANGNCLDLSHGDLAIGATVSFWSCGPGAANQIWDKGDVVGTPTGVPVPVPTEPVPTGEPVPTATGEPEPVPTATDLPTEPVSTGGPSTTGPSPAPTDVPTETSAPPTETSAPEPAPTDAPAPVGQHIVPAKDTTKCLTASANADGAPVVLGDCSADASQAWTSDGVHLVVYGDKCLDVTEGRNEKGTKLQIWTCVDGGSNQMFKAEANNHIAWLNFDKCLDVTNGVYTDGTPIQLWQCSQTTKNQSWMLA